MKPKVSIIMPVYNAERYLPETLRSITNQTFENIEIICVDDGSTDNSLGLLREYQKRDGRIKVLEQKNQYAGIARNNGLAHAVGEYVLFLDSDDLFDRNMISYLVRKADEAKPDIIVFGYYRFVDNVKHRRPARNMYKEGLYSPKTDLQDTILQVTNGMPWDKLFNREFVNRTGLKYQGTKINNDIFFNRMIVTEADKILFCTKRLVSYRINNSSSLQGKLNQYPTDFMGGNMDILEELKRRGTYSIFKNSYDSKVIYDVLTHLKQIHSYEEFESIFSEIRRVRLFQRIEINHHSALITTHPYRNTLTELMIGTPESCIASLLVDTQKVSVSKACIEYTIGSKIIKMLGLTY